MKTKNNLFTVDEFIEYYYDASNDELRAVKKTLESHNTGSGQRKNEMKAVIALLH